MRRFAIFLCCTSLAPAFAADNYTANYPNANGQPQAAAASTLDAILGSSVGIGSANIPIGRALPFDLSLRGVAASITAVSVPSGTVALVNAQLLIPATGANVAFTDPSWQGLLDQVKRFLLQGSEAKRLQRESARRSPFDPVAGNPSSLMARSVANDFARAFEPFASNSVDGPVQVAQVGGLPAGALRGPLPGLPGAGAQVALWRDAGRSARAFTLPLSYTLRSDLDPRRQFSFSLPLAVTSVDGATSVQGNAAAALRLPLARDWSLTTSVGYAMVSAPDLGSAGKIGSMAVTSSYVVRGEAGDLAIGNMLGHYRTLGGTINGIDTGSGISNTVLRNGLLWSMPAPAWLGFGRSVEYSLVNTHYTGTALYLRNYSELGLAVGSNKRADSARSYMQGGLSLLLSSKTRGAVASFGYWF